MWQQFSQERTGAGEQPVFDAGLVGPGRDMDGDLRHGNSIIAYRRHAVDRIDYESGTILPL